MAARLPLERQREGRIGVDVDRVDRIHLDRDGETHAPPASSCATPRSDSAIRGLLARGRLSGPDADLLPGPIRAAIGQHIPLNRDAALGRREIGPRDMQKDRAAAPGATGGSVL